MYLKTKETQDISQRRGGFKAKTAGSLPAAEDFQRRNRPYLWNRQVFGFSDAPQKVKPLVPNSKGQEVKFLRYHPNWRINARFTAVVTAWLLTRPNVGRFSRPPSWSHSPRSPHPVSPKGALFAVLHRVLFPIIGFDITAILSHFLRFVKSAQPENCKFPRGKQEKPTRKMRMKGAATETLCFSQNNPKTRLPVSCFPAGEASYNGSTEKTKCRKGRKRQWRKKQF